MRVSDSWVWADVILRLLREKLGGAVVFCLPCTSTYKNKMKWNRNFVNYSRIWKFVHIRKWLFFLGGPLDRRNGGEAGVGLPHWTWIRNRKLPNFDVLPEKLNWNCELIENIRHENLGAFRLWNPFIWSKPRHFEKNLKIQSIAPYHRKNRSLFNCELKFRNWSSEPPKNEIRNWAESREREKTWKRKNFRTLAACPRDKEVTENSDRTIHCDLWKMFFFEWRSSHSPDLCRSWKCLMGQSLGPCPPPGGDFGGITVQTH